MVFFLSVVWLGLQRELQGAGGVFGQRAPSLVYYSSIPLGIYRALSSTATRDLEMRETDTNSTQSAESGEEG